MTKVAALRSTKTVATKKAAKAAKTMPAATPHVPPTGDLAQRAMLVALWTSMWGNRKTDEAISDKVAKDHNADRTMGSYNKKLIAREALQTIGSIKSQARKHHYEMTLPWLDNGYRILPAANYLAYMTEQRRFREEMDKAIDQFVSDWPDFVKEARQRLGKMFNSSDYPTEAQLRSRFSIAVSVTPLPTGEDFRVALPGSEIGKVRREIEERLQKAFEDATRDLWQRLHEAILHLRDRLAAYEVDGKGKTHNPFRDSAVLNLRELCELLPRLNVNNDPELESMRKQLVAGLAAAKPETLRLDDKARAEAIGAANDVLKVMAGYVAG